MLLVLAWRNIWRNRSRSLITMGAVMCFVLLATFTASIQKGVFENLIKNVVSLYSGHVQLHGKGYWEEQNLEHCFYYEDSLKQIVKSEAGVLALAGRLESYALASSGDITTGCLAMGIEPAQEQTITHAEDKLVSGAYLEDEDQAILVAEGLASRLNLGLGDTLILLSQGFYGSTAAAQYPIKGLLHFGSPELNKRVVYMPLAQAQNWLDAPGYASALAMALEPGAEPNEVAQVLRTEVDTSVYEVMSWEELMPEVVQYIKADTGGMYIFLGVLYLLISFGIFSTLLMMFAERQREFGMLISLGMHKSKIALMVLMESITLTFAGALAGGALSLPFVLYFNRYPLRMDGEINEVYEQFGFEPIFPTSLEPSVFLIQAGLVFLVGFVLGLYPFWKIMRMDPVKAMRT